MKRHWLFRLCALITLLDASSSAAQGTATGQQAAGAGGSPGATTPDNAPPAVEPEYCEARLLSPIHELAGLPPLAAVLGQKPQPREPTDPLGHSRHFKKRVDDAASLLKLSLGATSANVEIKTVIATLPDPIDSGLVYSFETMLQALRLGFEAGVRTSVATNALDPGKNGWFRDRSFLPWADRQVGATSRAASEACRKLIPGLLLFRNSDLENPQVLMVLVVGETPTSGLHGAAFSNALRIASWVRSDKKAALSIVGPTFSGSAYSLRVGIEAFTAQSAAYVIKLISGTASGSEVPKILNHNEHLTYRSTTVPESDADCAYLHFLHCRLGVEAQSDSKFCDEGPIGNAKRPNTHAVLEGVATLRESGTEFGVRQTSSVQSVCDLSSELELTFPIHVSMLRDAYEDLEHRAPLPELEVPIARPAELDATVVESRIAPDLEASPSPKTRGAMDAMLRRVLGAISRRAVSHVSIHATDTGDAIFLARRIRDIAPAVRIAFFEPDDILLHSEHRAELLGSLVVSPYPFLGAGDVQSTVQSLRARDGFPNASAQGLFNAVLAQRGASPKELSQYRFDGPAFGDEPNHLLTWTSTIARTGLVPLDFSWPSSPEPTTFHSDDTREHASTAASSPSQANTTPARDKSPFDIPRVWQLAFLVLVLIFLIDGVLQTRAAGRLSNERVPYWPTGTPPRDNEDIKTFSREERAADRAIGRTKWWLYAAIRRLVFVLAFGYFGAIYVLAAIANYHEAASMSWQLLGCLTASALLLAAVVSFSLACQHFLRDYRDFSQYVSKYTINRPSDDLVSEPSSLRQLTGTRALEEARCRSTAASSSFKQLQVAMACAVMLSGYFIWLTIDMVADPVSVQRGSASAASLTLLVLRTMPLMSGVSPATPLLLCIACVYVCVVGRMGRLLLAHSISRMTPCDREYDLASTPIRLVLYPDYDGRAHTDEGFTETERDLLNTIWRPIVFEYYRYGLATVVAVPVSLFLIKPLSTIEVPAGHSALHFALWISAVLVGVVVVQLLLYWRTLARLLQRTAAHPLAPAFARLPDFARVTLEGQMSDTLLRWVLCARQLGALVQQLPYSTGLSERAAAVEARVQKALRPADSAIEPARNVPLAPHDAEASKLAESVVAAAVEISRRLQSSHRVRSWQLQVSEDVRTDQLAVGQSSLASSRNCVAPPESGDAADFEPILPSDRTRLIALPGDLTLAASSGAVASERKDAISDTAPRDSRADNTSYQQAQEFIVAVVALLVQPHIRQLRHYMSTLVGASMLLLLAIASYPFEPYRLLMTCMWVMICGIIAVGLWIYAQLNRSPLLRDMSQTNTSRVSVLSGTLWRWFAWAIVPLLSLAAAQFPNFANMLVRLLSPFLRALR